MNLKEWQQKNNVSDISFYKTKTLQYKNSAAWYENSNKIIKELFSTEPDLFIKLLASSSPRNTVKRNTELACDAFYNITRNEGRLIVYGMANKVISNNIDKVKRGIAPSGIKVNNFIDSLKLIDGAVCIDVWMLKAFNLSRSSPTTNDIVHITHIIKLIANKLNMTTYQVQACLWTYAKTELNTSVHKDNHDFSYFIHKANNKYKLTQTVLQS